MKNTDYMSLKALHELTEIRAEMKKSKPDHTKIFNLLCGEKYNIPINGNKRNNDNS